MMSSTATTTMTTTNQLEVHQRRRRRRRRTITILVALACAGAGVQYHALTPGLLRRRLAANYDDDGTAIVPPPFLPPFPLVNGDGVLEGMMPAVVPPPPREEEEVDAASASASASASAEGEVDDPAIVTHSRLIDTGMPLPPYSIEDAVRTSRMFDNTQAILVYDPEKDTFYALYSKRHNWVTGCNKLLTSFRILTYLLRRTLPERFMGAESDELGEWYSI
jgi:hypothetical protein